MIPMHEPLEVVKCKKCSRIMAKPKELIRIAGKFEMANYHICPICREPIEVEKYTAHIKTHGEVKNETDSTKLKQILDDAEKAFSKKKKANAITLFFEIARRVFSEVEKVDTSSWDYVFDYEIPNIMADIHVSVPSPYPPVMCHIKFRIKDKGKFDELIKKYGGTKQEAMLKEMVSTNKPIVVVHEKEWSRLYFQWKSEGKSFSDILMLTVYFFLHEMYHIIGFGEKDSTTKACIAMFQIFGTNVGIPEHEIERSKYEEKLKKGKKK